MANSSENVDYYSILEVDRKASLQAIKTSYRRLARQLHPDLNPNDTAAAENFKRLNEAYEVLSNPAQRRQYDRYGVRWQETYPPASSVCNQSQDDFDDIEFGRFSSFDDLLGDLLNRYSE
jgi:curved DNA-binding protein